MFKIHSTYDEFAPEYDDYPAGRAWPGEHPTREAAYQAIRAYLLTQQRWREAPHPHRNEPGLAPFGHAWATALPSDNIFFNDAETIHLIEA